MTNIIFKIENNFEKILKSLINQPIVFHFICPYCDDKQVTCEIDNTKDQIDFLVENGYIALGYSCTNCEKSLRVLDFQYITHIETWENF